MKWLGMKLHFLNDPTYIGGRSIHLKVENANIILHISDASKTAKEKKPQRKFAHVSKKKLLKWVKESKGFNNNKEFLKCTEECSDNRQTFRK